MYNMKVFMSGRIWGKWIMDFVKEVKLVYLLFYFIGFCNKFFCINYLLFEVDKVNM